LHGVFVVRLKILGKGKSYWNWLQYIVLIWTTSHESASWHR
jgi:hypothetical protein